MKELARAQGEDIPDPYVPDHLRWIWAAFHRLSRDRPWIGAGMSGAIPGSIPWRDIALYAEIHGADQLAYRTLDYCILKLDAYWVERWHMLRPKTAS